MKAPTPFWDGLRAQVAVATSRYGERSKLADEFHVSRQSLSQWLTGAALPSPEITLRLLEWVTAREAKPQQKKRAGSADTRPAQTRNGKIKRNEKPKSEQNGS